MISAEQVQRFDEDGFLVLPSFLDPATLAELRDAYDEIIDGLAPAAGDRMLGGLTRQVMIPSQAHPAFDRNTAVRDAIHIGRQMFDTDAVHRSFDMLIYKPPGHPHETPWHQDMSYAGQPFAPAGATIPLESIQIWIALDDADEENGCMQFLPGYHHRPLLEHMLAGGAPDDDGRLLALADVDRDLDLTKKVVAPVPAGGATIHSYGTPHYTGPNRSADRPRRAYIFNVATRAAMRGMAS